MRQFRDRLCSLSWTLCALVAACAASEPDEEIATSALTSPPQPSLSGSTCNNFGTIFSSGRVYYAAAAYTSKQAVPGTYDILHRWSGNPDLPPTAVPRNVNRLLGCTRLAAP